MNRYLCFLKAEELRPNDPDNREILHASDNASTLGSGGAFLGDGLLDKLPKLTKMPMPTFSSFAGSPSRQDSKSTAAYSERLRDECAGALSDSGGGVYLPWGPYFSKDQVIAMRAELVTLIDQLGAREQWDTQRLTNVHSRAARGPLSDMLPNLHYFRARAAGKDI